VQPDLTSDCALRLLYAALRMPAQHMLAQHVPAALRLGAASTNHANTNKCSLPLCLPILQKRCDPFLASGRCSLVTAKANPPDEPQSTSQVSTIFIPACMLFAFSFNTGPAVSPPYL